MTVLYGSSGIGEPEYRGGIYSPDLEAIRLAETAEPITAPVVELGLEYDSTPAWQAGLGWKIPGWLVLVGVAAWAANYAGLRIGGR